jgi:hypothetical protein
MRCVILDQDGFSIDFPEDFEAGLKTALRPDETGFSVVRGVFVQEGVSLFLACRVGETEQHRVRFALVTPESLGSEELVTRYKKAQPDLTSHRALLAMFEAALNLQNVDPKTLN